MFRNLKDKGNLIKIIFSVFVVIVLIFLALAFTKYRKVEPTESIGIFELFNFVSFYDGGYHKTASSISGLPITRDMKITHSFWNSGIFHVFFNLSEEQANKLYEACEKNTNYSLLPYVPSFYVGNIYGIKYRVQDISYDDGDVGCYFSSKSIAERDGIASIKLNRSKKELSIHVLGTN